MTGLRDDWGRVMTGAGLKLAGVANAVLREIDLAVGPGTFMTVVGPSGAGKSTLLKAIAGLVAHRGTIGLDGRALERLPTHRRSIGYVPQDLCLFPHRTVAGNILLALERSACARSERAGQVGQLLAMLGIDHLADRRPAELSGGERQRVALARALARQPRLLLLDEPFSNLDRRTTRRLRSELRRLHDTLNLITLMVTHDLDEAWELGDAVALVEEGRLTPARPGRTGFLADWCEPHRVDSPPAVDAVDPLAVAVLSDAELMALLEDDVSSDFATDLPGIAARPVRLTFSSGGEMVVAAVEEAGRLVELCGGDVIFAVQSGTVVAAGAVLLVAQGPAGALYRACKVARTLVEYASGIASRTRRIVEAARQARAGVVVACTEQTFSGTKPVVIRAVAAGGGVMRPCGRSETVLLFPEHRVLFAGNATAVLATLKARAPEQKIAVETADLDEAEELGRAGADMIQLQKMPPECVADLASRLHGLAARPRIAVAGDVTADNAAAYAAAGADILVTSAPYFGQPLDVTACLSPR